MLHHRAVRKADSTKYSPWHDFIRIRQNCVFYSTGFSSIFIAIVCFAAVIVIAFTRCMTIALLSRRVYDDLRHLGAPNAYLFRSVKGQVSRVFLVPAMVGTGVICAFYAMIMYFNDNRFTPGEIAGMGTCAAVVAALSLVLYGVYRFTRRSVCRSLGI